MSKNKSMQSLPQELVLEILKRASCYDAVMLGATCKEYHALSREALQRREVKRSVLDSFTYVIYLLMNHHRRKHTGRGGFVGHVYRMPPNQQTVVGTRALHLYPSMWTTYLHGHIHIDNEELPLMISISLTVIPHNRLKDWEFRFRIGFSGDYAPVFYEEFPEQALYQLTTTEERRNAAISLLASWYSHIRETLNGRCLRSYKKKGWLPAYLPPLYAFVRAAYTPMRAFICNL